MRAFAAAVLLALVAGPSPARADNDAYGVAFVSAFAEACVPERLSYPGTKANAERLGWRAAERSDHAELAAIMARMDEGTEEVVKEMDGTFDFSLYGKDVAGAPHFLIVARSSFLVDFGDEPERWTYIGCHLYNLDAADPIDPAPVTALIDKPISDAGTDNGLTGYVWGPPCAMPRTGDTYMAHIAEGSPHVDLTGFSGLAIKLETSEPDPGEIVPETYC